jgi:putative DNA primase/helicase
MTITAENIFDIEVEEVAAEIAPQFSEDAMALEFTERHADHVRYVAQWKRWFRFDGRRWVHDNKMQVYNLARMICRDTAALAQQVQTNRNRSGEAKKIANSKTRAGVVSLASDDQRLAATIDQWDADPWLLNTPGGVIDLRTGSMRPHDPNDYMTKITAVAPDRDYPIPLWTAFMQRVHNNDDELIRYHQRVSGYCLTGITREHAMWIFFGTGRNGKGVQMNTEANIMGDYHATAPVATFLASNSDRHPTDLAGLHGARLVSSERNSKRPLME